MSQHEAELLAQIYATPHDDAPRLVYADWLQERGDPRGEFIVLQMERHRKARRRGEHGEEHDSGDHTRDVPGERERQLLAAHGKDWLGPLAPVLIPDTVVFRRGFVAEGRAHFESNRQKTEALAEPAWATIEKLSAEPDVLVHPGLTSLWSIGPIAGGPLLILSNAPLPNITELRVAPHGDYDEALLWQTLHHQSPRHLRVPNLERLEILHHDTYELSQQDMRARGYDSRFRSRYGRGLRSFVLRRRVTPDIRSWMHSDDPRPDLAQWADSMFFPHYPRRVVLLPCHGWTFTLTCDEDRRVGLRIDWHTMHATGDLRVLELALRKAGNDTFRAVHVHISGFERPHYREQLAVALHNVGEFTCSSRDS